jgi:hypothetical protein
MNYKIIGMSIFIGLTSLTSFGQDGNLTNKNGKTILPEKGEISLGFSAMPVFSFVGNMFNNNSFNNPMGGNKFVNSMFSENAIFGKYMLDDKTAIRSHFRINIDNSKLTNYVINDAANSPDSLTTDVMKQRSQLYVIGAGYEKRRGKGRLQGIYGGEGFFMFGKSTSSYEYGNQFGMLNQAPTSTTNFLNGQTSSLGMRTSSSSTGNTFGLGIRPFVGVEYFVAPKISLGAEFGWSLMFSRTGDGIEYKDYYEPNSGNVLNKSINTGGRSNFSLDTDNFNGSIYFLFYF